MLILFNQILPDMSYLQAPLTSTSFTTSGDFDLAAGRKVSTKQNLLASFCCTVFGEWDEICYDDEAVQAEHPELTCVCDLLDQGK